MQKRSRILLILLISVTIAAALLLQTFEVKMHFNIEPTSARAQRPATAVPVPIKFDGEYLPRNLFIQISKAVNPAVVNISTTQKIRRQPRGFYFGGPSGDPFQDFLEQFMGGGGMPQVQEQPVMSLGTGFIIEPDGLIVTNNHVIAEAGVIKVQLEEKSKKLYTGKVVGRDPKTDLALIKINPENPLPVAVLGDSDKVEVGEWVSAFGNPYGHGHTMTVGIISAKERDIPGEAMYFPYLQTDASINPGNSGGPLTNSAGEVIGVNAAIDARAQGIGFAIPINALKEILPQLKKGKVIRGYLGVSINDVDERIQKQLHLKADKGSIVLNIMPNSPAEKAGIQNYDVITEFDGKPVVDSRTLMIRVGETPVGKTVKIKVLRDGRPQELNIKIEEPPADGTLQGQGPGGQGVPGVPSMKAPFDLGLAFSQLTPELAQQLEIEEAPLQSVVVTAVAQGSPADAAGFSVGDIILDINRHRVLTPRDAVKAFKHGQNSVRILRQDGTALLFLGAK